MAPIGSRESPGSREVRDWLVRELKGLGPEVAPHLPRARALLTNEPQRCLHVQRLREPLPLHRPLQQLPRRTVCRKGRARRIRLVAATAPGAGDREMLTCHRQRNTKIQPRCSKGFIAMTTSTCGSTCLWTRKTLLRRPPDWLASTQPCVKQAVPST